MKTRPIATHNRSRHAGWSGVLLAALLAACAGCASVSTATHPLDAERIKQMRADLEGRRAEVSLATPAPAPSPGVRAASPLRGRIHLEDAMVKVVDDRERVQSQPLVQVREINASHRDTGAGYGLLAGAVGGALVGAIFGGLMVGRDCSGSGSTVYYSHECYSRGSAAGDGAVYFALPGALLGTIIGAAVGAGPIWRFSPAPGGP